MNVKEQLLLLLRMYADGKYDTASFCDQFCVLYFFENNGRSLFFGEERRVLDAFATVVERYTNLEEDLQKYPDVYVGNDKVSEAFEFVKSAFRL
ncbi:MAG: hypothetical protein IJS45_04455 [Clostridia bacterium]|nr:hypothetical protein [Clostridia bacterium]